MNESASTSRSEASPPAWRQKLVLLVLALLFLGPFIGAYLYYFVGTGFPDGSTNRGKLVEPVRALAVSGVWNDARSEVTRGDFLGRWTLLYLADRDCPDACAERLYELRQLHTLLNHRGNRVRRVLVMADAPSAAAARDALSELHPRLTVYALDGSPNNPMLEQFRIDEKPPLEAGRVYLLDPLANWVLYYEADAGPEDVLKDIKKLLRLSRIG